MNNRPLRDGEIAKVLNTYEDSDDGMEDDDDSITDPDYQLENEADGVNLDEIIQFLEESEQDPSPCTASASTIPQSSQPGPSRKPQKLNLRWMKKNLILNEQQLRFLGNENLTADILELDTPIQIFSFMFPKGLIDFIATQTNLYIVQKDPNNNFRVSSRDIQKFIGIVYINVSDSTSSSYLPVIGIPNRYSYNSRDNARKDV